MSIVSALLAAVLAAIALVACGGDEDSSTTAATPPTETTAPQQESGTTPDDSKNEQTAESPNSTGNGSDSSGAGGTSSEGNSDSSAPAPKASSNSVPKGKTGPVRVSGGGSAPLLTNGGDNSIQEFGDEADEGELEAAAIVAHGYLVGRATGDWPAACGYVSKGMQEQLDQLASGSAELKGKGCPAVMAALTSGVPGSALAALTEVDALSLRNDGERGFLIYRSGDGTNYFMPMAQEDGAWKVTALASTPLS
jgi:hypothetical protein